MQKSIFVLLFAVSSLFIFSCKSETKTSATSHSTPSTTQETPQTKEKAPEVKEVSLENANYVVNPSKSMITWEGSKVTGKKHNGTINLSSGSFVISDAKVMAGQATFDMNSIDVKDLTGKWKTKLEGHLKSPDFFDVTTYPTATITVKNNGSDSFEGVLDLHGIKKTIQIPATVTQEGEQFVVTVKPTTIDRTNWGVKYNSAKFFQNLGDKLINDEINISGKLVLEKKPKG